jgi:hypothetical protein
MENAQIQATMKVWQSEAANMLSKLRRRTLGGPKVLAGSSWTMNLQMGQSGLTRLTEPTAIFEMVLSDPPSTTDVSASRLALAALPHEHSIELSAQAPPEKFMLEFSHDELYEFFTSVERIQTQLDSLS